MELQEVDAFDAELAQRQLGGLPRVLGAADGPPLPGDGRVWPILAITRPSAYG
ncbi:hypothetical protein [Kribbella sp. DT2]|uniref:hypothetical protein n=1 Tax=Kribbella sp. DT2 TaxID=3393427 RepID=UPI003CF922BC